MCFRQWLWHHFTALNISWPRSEREHRWILSSLLFKNVIYGKKDWTIPTCLPCQSQEPIFVISILQLWKWDFEIGIIFDKNENFIKNWCQVTDNKWKTTWRLSYSLTVCHIYKYKYTIYMQNMYMSQCLCVYTQKLLYTLYNYMI